jgi:hypothetical protein
VKAAAERRVAEAAARETMAKAVRTLGLPIDVDPGKALLDEIHWTAGHVAWLRDKVQELETVDRLTRAPTTKPSNPIKCARAGHPGNPIR